MAVEDTVFWHFYIEFEGFTSQHVRLWQSQRDEVYLVQKKNGIRFADRVRVVNEIEKEKQFII